MAEPKVSIVIPCYNVAKYVRQCLDSVVNQTLREIEIICVNDGSTDTTLAILETYAQRDSRVIIIDKPNGGYGHSMNQGFDVASGEYLGIVESDDFVEPHMFETLYTCAKQHNLDVANGGYFLYREHPEISNTPVQPPIKYAGEGVFCPMTDLLETQDQIGFFKSKPVIWSAIYRREFIRENGIRFLESPGASYQDTGFIFKVMLRARRVKLLKDCLIHYRTDNEASSVHNPGKVYCLCDEHEEMWRYAQQSLVPDQRILPLLVRLKYERYIWNYERLSEPLQAEFIRRFAEEFRLHQEQGFIRKKYFSWSERNNLHKLMLDPDRFHQLRAAKVRGEEVEEFYDAYPEKRPMRLRQLYFLAENVAGACQTARESGWSYTAKLFFSKVANRLRRKKTPQPL